MRLRLKRRHGLWLSILAAMIGTAALSGMIANPAVLVTLIALFSVALIASTVELNPNRLVDRSRSSLTAMRMSTEAREAVERARRRGGHGALGVTLLDVGVFSSQAGGRGLEMRRDRTISQDDDGVRPFIQVHVQPESADRQVKIRFEMIDQNGTPQYVHEMRTYLRDGEMNILPDHHMPLAGNDRLNFGDWDLRVFIDGSLTAAHSFNLIPSVRDRFGRLERDAARNANPQQAADRLAEDQRVIRTDDTPMSLEELLKHRGENSSRQ